MEKKKELLGCESQFDSLHMTTYKAALMEWPKANLETIICH